MSNSNRAETGRDELGRYLPGHEIAGTSGGRPRKVEIQAKGDRAREYLHVVMEACSLDEWREIAEKAVEQAKRGDKHARNWLTAFTGALEQAGEVNEVWLSIIAKWRQERAAPLDGSDS